MMWDVSVYPLVMSHERFVLHSFFIDAPEPAIVDTGIASTPADVMVPALEAVGRRIEDVRWILLTHGHIDHVGGAYALWELTGRKAQIAIHEADAPMLRSRRAHVDDYLAGRAQYLNVPGGEAKQIAATQAVISGEMEPDILLKGGETLCLGGEVAVSVHNVPGHSAGSVAYVVEGQNAVFAGDAVQVHGAASGFPTYSDPHAYRSSLEYLRDEIRPRHMYLGHSFRRTGGAEYGVELDEAQARAAIRESLSIEACVERAAQRCLQNGLRETDSIYSPFASAAAELGYTGDPTLEPCPFFTTLHGYRMRAANESWQRKGQESSTHG